MAGKNYKIKVALSDGSTKELPFTAPEGPRGPKGDCRGVSVHKVSTLQDFAALYNSLSDTQEILGMEAHADTGIPVSQEYVFSVVDDYVAYYAIASSGAIKEFGFTLGDQGSFKIQTSSASGATDADYVNVYVYDSETPPETVNQAVFPSLAGPFKQAKVPAYPSLSAIPTSETAVASAFNFGAWEPHVVAHNGNYVAFAYIGGHLNAITASYDFNINVWTWKEATPLSKGSMVMLEDSREGHVYIVTLEAQNSATAIFNVVKPIVGRIPIELDTSAASNITLAGFEHADIMLKLGTYGIRYTVYLSSVKDCSLYCDTTNYSYPDPANGRRQLTITAMNDTRMFLALPYRMGSESAKTSPNVGNFGYFYGTDGFEAKSRTIDFCEWPRYVFDEEGKFTSAGFNYYIDEIAESAPGDTKKVCCHVAVNVDSAGIVSVQPDPFLK